MRKHSFITSRRLALALVAVLLGSPIVASTAQAAGVESSSLALAGVAEAALDEHDLWRTTGDPEAYVRFLQARDDAAMMAAAELGLDAFAMRDAWARTAPVKQRAVLAAVSQLGVPYRSMASNEGVGFDCSGLTSYAFRRAGVEIPRPSRGQINEAERVDRAAAQAGDLVYYPGHVSMYLGVGEAIVHSPNSGHEVEITFSSPRRVSSLRYGDPTA
jgi:cell wall-associated NlpC family hydrolase